MSKHAVDFDANLAQLGASEWITRLDELAEELGYCEPLGQDHMVAFLDAGPKLLVTFENAEAVRSSRPASEPRGFDFVRNEGWSHLAILSEGESWFRDKSVYGYFDRLVDDGFFEDFEDVLFYGAHAAGYAACAFSVAAPGANVLAIRPQATLDPRVTGFDSRYSFARRQDFTTRYGYAPDMIDAANRVHIVFDPLQRMDAMHASLFARINVVDLRCPGLGWKIDAMLDAVGVHSDLIRDAMAGQLTRQRFARMMRQRHRYAPYLRVLVNRAIQQDHPVMAANVCAYVLRKGKDSFFAAKLEELREQGHIPSRPLSASAAE